MKLNKLVLASALLLTGSLVSCNNSKEVTVGVGYSASFTTGAAGQLDLTTAFAAFDKNGKVVDARFDVVQVKITANAEKTGAVLTDKNKVEENSVLTKLELGADYGMLGSSNIGKEVDAQIEAFADWTVGKTVAEVKAGIVPGSGHGTPVNEELTTSVTITVDAFVDALENAYETKADTTYKVGKAKAGLAMTSNLNTSGTEINVVVGGALVEGSKVVAAGLDEVVFPLVVDSTSGEFTGDTSSKYYTNGVLKSKYVLGAEYAMASTSPIRKEWYEQCDVITAACVNKTGEQITAMEKGTGDLTGATINVASYLNTIAKAAKYAPLANVAVDRK